MRAIRCPEKRSGRGPGHLVEIPGKPVRGGAGEHACRTRKGDPVHVVFFDAPANMDSYKLEAKDGE